jgi:hypothetical protein
MQQTKKVAQEIKNQFEIMENCLMKSQWNLEVIEHKLRE